MAGQRRQPGDEAADDATTEPATPEAQVAARAHEAADAEDSLAAVIDAQERRDRSAERRAAQRKQYEGEEPPMQVKRGGEIAYSVDRLIENATEFLGYPSHVVAGGLADVIDPYLTIKEATRLVEEWHGESGSQARARAAREES